MRRFPKEPLKTLLLLPGMDGTTNLLLDLMHRLPQEWKKTAPIDPSDVAVPYSAHCKMLQITAPAEEPFVLIAESYSTPVAIQYAATKPANLKGLVLCAGFASSPIKGWRKFLAQWLRHILFRLPLTNFAIDRYLLGPNPEESLRNDVRRAINSVKPEVLSSRLASVIECDVRAELKNISVPILYIQAESDRLVGPICVEEILHGNPNVKIETIPGPHLLFQREPQRAAEIVESFARVVFKSEPFKLKAELEEHKQ